MNKVLFEITEENLETGLRGYPVGYCQTSTVDPTKGLFYAGVPVEECAVWEPEEVIYLLYYGKRASSEEVKQFAEELRKRGTLSPETVKHIRLLPRTGHPMKLFCASLLICGMYESTGDYREDCLNIIAKAPELAATIINYHAGWEGKIESNSKLGYMENFTQMLHVPNASKERLKQVFQLFNILHFDHGGGNLSTFVGKAVASGLEDMYGSLSTAMAALAGPRHGKANQDALEFTQYVLKKLGATTSVEQVESLIRNRLENKELVHGFGHAVLRVEDPRAAVLYHLLEERYQSNPLAKTAILMRQVGPKVLAENPKISNPYPNVDAVSGVLLTAAGFPYSQYYTVLFGLARLIGIAIQIVYERCEAREGKGTPIVRPKYIYSPRK